MLLFNMKNNQTKKQPLEHPVGQNDSIYILQVCGVFIVTAMVIMSASLAFGQYPGTPIIVSPSFSPRPGSIQPMPLYTQPFSGQGMPSSKIFPMQTIPISNTLFSGIIPPVPNLQIGYLYTFGKDLSTGRLLGDYLIPINMGTEDTVFAQAHIEAWNYWKTPAGYSQHRLDLSMGGGYRKFWENSFVGGINGFYDGTRLFGKWYSSGGVGLEAAAVLGDTDILDLNFNYYGRLFNYAPDIAEVFRNGPRNYDFEAGYSHRLFSPDFGFRLKAAGYRFDVGAPVHGWRAGADLTVWSGMCELRYEAGADSFNGTYQTVGAYINIPIQLEKIFSGHDTRLSSCASTESPRPPMCSPGLSPCNRPHPIYVDPSGLRKLLGRPVRRQYTSYAVRDPDPQQDSPVAWLATGDAVVVFNLTPQYSAEMLQNRTPSKVQVNISVNSRGSVDVTGLQLHVKEADTVWLLALPDWTTSMGNRYSYSLSIPEINALWDALLASRARIISQVRFNHLTGAQLEDLRIELSITQ